MGNDNKELLVLVPLSLESDKNIVRGRAPKFHDELTHQKEPRAKFIFLEKEDTHNGKIETQIIMFHCGNCFESPSHLKWPKFLEPEGQEDWRNLWARKVFSSRIYGSFTPLLNTKWSGTEIGWIGGPLSSFETVEQIINGKLAIKSGTRNEKWSKIGEEKSRHKKERRTHNGLATSSFDHLNDRCWEMEELEFCRQTTFQQLFQLVKVSETWKWGSPS